MKGTLLGDSIRMQYGPRVAQLLDGSFEVWAPQENCRCSHYTLRGLFDWAEGMRGSDIVHWNNGHWDICRLFGDGTFTQEEDFVYTMLRIADILQKRHRAVIFAPTTPVLSANVYNSNDDIDRFNRRITPLLQERGVIINDLNALLRSDTEKYICDDTIHLSEAGIERCAQQVAAYVRKAAEGLADTADNGARNDSGNADALGAPVLL